MSLTECSHRGLTVHDCGHYEDVSIVCGNGACLSFLYLNFIRSRKGMSKAFILNVIDSDAGAQLN